MTSDFLTIKNMETPAPLVVVYILYKLPGLYAMYALIVCQLERCGFGRWSARLLDVTRSSERYHLEMEI